MGAWVTAYTFHPGQPFNSAWHSGSPAKKRQWWRLTVEIIESTTAILYLVYDDSVRHGGWISLVVGSFFVVVYCI